MPEGISLDMVAPLSGAAEAWGPARGAASLHGVGVLAGACPRDGWGMAGWCAGEQRFQAGWQRAKSAKIRTRRKRRANSDATTRSGKGGRLGTGKTRRRGLCLLNTLTRA